MNNLLKRKGRVKKWSYIKILIIGKHSSDEKIYLIANIKIKIKMPVNDTGRDAWSIIMIAGKKFSPKSL